MLFRRVHVWRLITEWNWLLKRHRLIWNRPNTKLSPATTTKTEDRTHTQKLTPPCGTHTKVQQRWRNITLTATQNCMEQTMNSRIVRKQSPFSKKRVWSLWSESFYCSIRMEREASVLVCLSIQTTMCHYWWILIFLVGAAPLWPTRWLTVPFSTLLQHAQWPLCNLFN